MKKSSHIRLVLLGSASIALAACDQGPPPDIKFFSDAKECSAVHRPAECEEAAKKSEQIHLAEAPKFSRKEECEAEFGAGNCETRQASNGGSIFLPLLMGYMMGKSFNQPVYRGPDNGAMMKSGGGLFKVGSFSGLGGRSAPFQPAAATPIKRGGFGSTATAMRSTSGG